MLSTILGLAALALWTASFVLMLRLATLERWAGGLDRLYWWHHACGSVAYVVLLAHPLAAAAGAAGWGQGRGLGVGGLGGFGGFGGARAVGSWSDAAAVLSVPGATGPMLAGWAAVALLMAMMLATFWLPLAYARWRTAHVAAVPAFALGAWHVWALGGPMVRTTVAALSAVAFLALAWRVALGRGWVRAHPHRVAQVAHPGDGLLDLVLEPVGSALDWRPGQFVFVAFFDGRGWRGCGEYHPYTIAGPAPHGGLRMLVRALGPCSAHLQSVRPGVRAMVQGPHGDFLAARSTQRAQLWIAGGIGITPFTAALSSPSPGGAGVDLVHVRRTRDTPAIALLASHADRLPAAVRVHDLVSDADAAESLWARIAERIGDVSGRQVFMCGPPGLVEALRPRLLAAGVAERDIHDERFDFR